MSSITAAEVKSLRDKTGLPLMECKRALQECDGDETAAIESIRKKGVKTQATRADRPTAEGRISIHAGFEPPVGAMIELQCESAPVAKNDDFIALIDALAKQLATGPGAATPDELWDQPSPGKEGLTLRQQKDDLFTRIREVFNLKRIVRFDGPCAGYVHHNGKSAVLLEVSGGDPAVCRDIAMHVTAMKPKVVNREDLDPELVEKEREILSEAAKTEGKPDNIVEKMVEGRMRSFYAETVLVDQPFVKEEKKTVGKIAKAAGAELVRFALWQPDTE